MTDLEGVRRAVWMQLGFEPSGAPPLFPTRGLSECRRATIVRQAEAGTFKLEERWIIAVLSAGENLDATRMDSLQAAAAAVRATDALVISAEKVPEASHTHLATALNKDDVALVLLSGPHLEALGEEGLRGAERASFSFARLRAHILREVEGATWKGAYQPETLSRADVYLPQKVRALHSNAEMRETDLVTAVAGGSCLLLGPPGSGKTTALLNLSAELARAGGRMAVFVRLGAYRGSLLKLVGEALGAGASAVGEEETRGLLATGVLAVLLDGLNEVQDPDLNRLLVNEINTLTSENEPSARSRWVVTGRTSDYEASFNRPTVVERRRWHLEPLSDDLVFRYLKARRGQAAAEQLWTRMAPSFKAMCRTPLLLSMLLGVNGEAPVSRGELYRRVIEDLLKSDDSRGLGQNHRKNLAKVAPALARPLMWHGAAMDALTAMAAGRRWTVMRWNEAIDAIAPGMVVNEVERAKVAELFLEELVSRGVLRGDPIGGVRFQHHTFQEFFAGRSDLDTPIESLLPIGWRQGRVPPERRETIRLLAGLRSDGTAIMKRVLALGDATLALEIAEDQPAELISSGTMIVIARELDANIKRGGFVGKFRRPANAFIRCAERLQIDCRDLVERLGSYGGLQIIDRAASIHCERGDGEAARRTLQGAIRDGVLPPELRPRAAEAACQAGDHHEAISLWTSIAEDPRTNQRQRATALNNRATSRGEVGRADEAERDYRASINLEDSAIARANLASTLLKRAAVEMAEGEARAALSLDDSFHYAHRQLAEAIERGARRDPDRAAAPLAEALSHRKAAVRNTPHEEDLEVDLQALVRLQENLGLVDEAVATYEELIALLPASSRVAGWKERIREHREKLAEERAQRSDREAVIADAHVKPQMLVRAWLELAQREAEPESSICWLVTHPSGDHTLVVLLPETKLGPHHLSQALEMKRSLSRTAQEAAHVLFVAATEEQLTGEVLSQIARLRASCSTGLLTAPEIRDAIVEGRGACHQLFDDALPWEENPFETRGLVKLAAQFWGRQTDRQELTRLLQRGKSFGLYGIHKVGKSSLLWQVRHHLRSAAPEITTVWMEMDATIKDAQDFFARLGHALGKLAPEQARAPDSPPSAMEIRATLEDLHRGRQRQFPGHRIALILDEYAYLIPDGKKAPGIAGFDEVLGLLKTLVQEGWLLFVPCGRTAALTRQGNFGDVENPFLALLPARFLTPMPRAEHHSMMTDLAMQKRAIRFSDAALDRLFLESGGHPRFARDLGALLFEQRSGVVGLADADWATAETLDDADRSATALAIYETRMSEVEQAISMTAASSAGGIDYQDAFPRAATESQRIAIRDGIRNLVDTGVLMEEKRDGRRRLTHRIGLLRRTLERRAEDLGMDARWTRSEGSGQ